MYLYVYLDVTEKGVWHYDDQTFYHKPIYVGVGTRSDRKSDHWRCARLKFEGKNHNYINNIFYDKLVKLIKKGLRPKILKLYDNSTSDVVHGHEVAMIAKFGRLRDKNGGILCNIGIGGAAQHLKTSDDECSIIKFDIKGNIVCEYDNIDKIGYIDRKTLIVHLRGLRPTAGGCIYKYASEVTELKKLDVKLHMSKFVSTTDDRNRKIYRYGLGGEFQHAHKTHTDGAKFLGITVIRRSPHIRIIKGYIWSPVKYDSILISDGKLTGINSKIKLR